MKKIYKLKKWLSIEEAAKRLSIELGEEVTESDVLQLAVDEQLRISVNFPHDWVGKVCYLTTDDNVVKESQKELIGLDGKPFVHFEYRKCSETEYIKIDYHIRHFQAGIWELKLIGNEKIDLEWELKANSGLPCVDVINLSGFYVKNRDGIIIERQSHLNHKAKIRDDFKELLFEELNKNLNIARDKFNELLNGIEKDKNYPLTPFYYPCAGLGEIEGAFFVIQTEHLNEFIASLDDELSNADKLNLDSALYLLGEVLQTVKSKAKKWTQGEIINEILQFRQNENRVVQGLEQRTIEEYFSNANKRLKS